MTARLGQGRSYHGRLTWNRSPDVSPHTLVPSVLQSRLHVVAFKRICGHADTLRRGLARNVDTTQFLSLLHQFIENRSFNMALQNAINRSLGAISCFSHSVDAWTSKEDELLLT